MKTVYDQKSDLNEPQILISEEEALFVQEFVEYWNILRQYCKSDINEINDTCKTLFTNHTKSFFARWDGKISVICSTKEYIRDYSSFELIVRSGIHILIPHKLLLFEIMRGDERRYLDISKIKSLKELLFYVERSCREVNCGFNKNDVKILKELASNRFVGQSIRTPKIEDLSKLCGVHKNTMANHLTKLVDQYTLAMIYKVDPSIIGYETFLVLNRENPDLNVLNPYRLASNPTNLYSQMNEFSMNQLNIYQIPSYKYDVYKYAFDESDPFLFQPLTNEYYGWNLNGLTHDIAPRWRQLPPVLTLHHWNDDIQSLEKGMHVDLYPNIDIPHLASIDKEILDMYAIHNMIEDIEIAKQVERTEKYVRKSKQRLLDLKILKLFTSISNIGIGFKPWIFAMGNESEGNKQLFKRIIEHLKFFPFIHLFYNLEQSIPILTGYLYIPESWVSDFLYKWSELPNYGVRTEINQAYGRTIKWSVNISKTS